MNASIVDQVRLSLQKQNRMATIFGVIIGGFVPMATFFLVHFGVQQNMMLWPIVAGGLLFSAKTVYNWGQIAFSNSWKAFGFCVLVEGVMTFAPSSLIYLAVSSLAMLMGINGIATGCNLALNSREFNSAKRAAARATKPVFQMP